MTVLNVSEGTILASLRCCFSVMPNTVLLSSGLGTYSGSIWRTKYFPPFFFLRISKASALYPGAITPSDTSRLMIFAVGS